MLFRRTELDRIVDGTVDLAFRRWTTARVRRGTRLRTAIGLVEVTSVDETTVDAISATDARRCGCASVEELLTFLEQRPERPVFRIGLRYAGPDPRLALREEADLDDDDRARLTARLQRFDRASHRGPWTAAALAIISRRPGVRAADLASELGLETLVFKRDVRKLKELGLTESLEIGYRLSPRGRAFMSTG
jgi:hypothetical protein